MDDERFARSRAEQLAARGSGDALIRHDLEGRGIAAEHVETALDALEPERERAARLAEQRGRSVKTARYLASRGFGADALEGLVAAGGLRSDRIGGASIRRFSCTSAFFRIS